jgi:hypothetical protein
MYLCETESSLLNFIGTLDPRITGPRAIKCAEFKEANYNIEEISHIQQWFLACGIRTPGGTQWTVSGYVKIILVMAENTEKRS